MRLTIGQLVNWKRIGKGSNTIRRIPGEVIGLTSDNALIRLEQPIKSTSEVWVGRSTLESRKNQKLAP